MVDLTENERIVLNNLQEGFPVTEYPFRELEEVMELPAETILETLKQLDGEGLLSRFGAVLNTRSMGGDSRLAAMRVPEGQLDQVISCVNDFRTVSHNYLRDHELNLWFVLSGSSCDIIDETMKSIEKKSGLEVFDLPKLTEYYVGLKFRFHPDGSVSTVSRNGSFSGSGTEDSGLDPVERSVIVALEEGIPLDRRPYRKLAGSIDVEEGTVIEVLRGLIAQGHVKRLGCVPDHYTLGIRGNAMAVFDVPDRSVDAVGTRLGRRDEVTHCYRRPRHGTVWPYNLFAMVHDRTKENALETVQELREKVHLRKFDYDVLFSKRLLKKTGLRLTKDKRTKGN